MAYRVSFTRRARRDYLNIYEFTNATESVAAQIWLQRLEETIRLLAATPRMGSLTHEDETVRQIIYGNRPRLYRILYDIDDRDQRITVLSIWHGKRLPPGDLKA
jgi:toxin ParE1/3/4